MDYEKLLKELKNEFFDGTFLLTIGDKESNMVAVWPRVEKRVLEERFYNEDVPEVWNWIEFNAAMWARLANVHEKDVWNLWKGLAVSGVICPDGTWPEDVKEWVMKKVSRLEDE